MCWLMFTECLVITKQTCGVTGPKRIKVCVCLHVCAELRTFFTGSLHTDYVCVCVFKTLCIWFKTKDSVHTDRMSCNVRNDSALTHWRTKYCWSITEWDKKAATCARTPSICAFLLISFRLLPSGVSMASHPPPHTGKGYLIHSRCCAQAAFMVLPPDCSPIEQTPGGTRLWSNTLKLRFSAWSHFFSNTCVKNLIQRFCFLEGYLRFC